jgi:hypothetical protein
MVAILSFVRGLSGFFLVNFLSLIIISTLVLESINKENFKGMFNATFYLQPEAGKLYDYVVAQCSSETSIVLNYATENLTLDCQKIKAAESKEFPNLLAEEIFDRFYNKQYPCQFLQCLLSGQPENLLVIFSHEGNQFFSSVRTFSIILSLVFAGILAISSIGWKSRIRSFAFVFLFVSIPFVIFNFAIVFFKDAIPSAALQTVPLIQASLSKIQNIYIIFTAVGILLLMLSFFVKEKLKK